MEGLDGVLEDWLDGLHDTESSLHIVNLWLHTLDGLHLSGDLDEWLSIIKSLEDSSGKGLLDVLNGSSLGNTGGGKSDSDWDGLKTEALSVIKWQTPHLGFCRPAQILLGLLPVLMNMSRLSLPHMVKVGHGPSSAKYRRTFALPCSLLWAASSSLVLFGLDGGVTIWSMSAATGLGLLGGFDGGADWS